MQILGLEILKTLIIIHIITFNCLLFNINLSIMEKSKISISTIHEELILEDEVLSLIVAGRHF